jgi:MtN3 and saliva related transmembrane protein
MSTNIIGLVAGILTASSLVPQFIKILKEKKADDISVPMLVILMLGLSLWVYYGTIREDLPIVITNCFSLLFNIGILILKYKYRSAGSAVQN